MAPLTTVLLSPSAFSALATLRTPATTDVFGSAASHSRTGRPVWPVAPATTTVGDEDAGGEESSAAFAVREGKKRNEDAAVVAGRPSVRERMAWREDGAAIGAPAVAESYWACLYGIVLYHSRSSYSSCYQLPIYHCNIV